MFIIFICSLLLISGVSCIRDASLHVPGAILAGQPLVMWCRFDLEGEALYCVKWYKDNSEFYRYCPGNAPSPTTFNVPGVDVDLTHSNESMVTLVRSDVRTEGTYSCEVSAEGTYKTVLLESDVVTYVMPSGGPVIEGLKKRYDLGDTINVTCRSAPSKPPPRLKWYVNGKRAPSKLTGKTQVSLSPMADSLSLGMGMGVQAVGLNLRMPITSEDLRNKIIKLQCVSTIYKNLSEKFDEITYHPYLNRTLVVDPDGPRISGEEMLNIYDKARTSVEWNCTTRVQDSNEAYFEWTVNDEETTRNMTVHLSMARTGRQKTYTSRLRMTLEEKFVTSMRLKIRCTVVYSQPIQFVSEETIFTAASTSFHIMKISAGNAPDPDHYLILTTFSIAVPLTTVLLLSELVDH
ncbi:uncharacterized protein LOC111249184 [Varroa destructor]|uniref:Ig-like domain-containing protein n=1 Tax=Varroa destructor TaxID=109461 RepID=A0A7M7M8W6_VARDE|nr:uncharacterized protein LOC111249184 [Varroa destructor]